MDEVEKLDVESTPPSASQFLQKITTGVILVGLFLLPVAFIPSISFPFQFTKSILFDMTVLVAFILYVVARLKEGKIRIQETYFAGAGFIVVLVAFLASLFSGNVSFSFFGQGFEVGTFASILLSFILLFLTADLFRSRERIFYGFITFFLSALVVFVFQAIRLFDPSLFAFGNLFSSPVSNLIGRWNDLGIFFGISALLSLLMTEFLTLNRLFRGVLYGILAVSMLFLVVVNFNAVWIAIIIISLLVVSFGRMKQKPAEGMTSSEDDGKPQRTKIPYVPFVLVAISAIFLIDAYFLSQNIGTRISTALNIGQIEARPSWGSTAEIFMNTAKKDPLFGTGPNQFTEEWLLHKPSAINATAFWNTDFSFGVGLIPTLAVTTGIIGLLSWLLFLGMFLVVGFKSLFSRTRAPLEQFLVTASFLISLYLWIFMVMYVPSVVNVGLTFFFTGLFVASLGGVKEKTIVFADSPRKGFVMATVLIIMLVGAAGTGIVLARKFVAFNYFQNSIIAYNTTGSIAVTDALLQKAVGLSESDLNNRFLSQLNIVKINDLLSKDQESMTPEEFRTKFQAIFADALQYAKRATELNADDYQNWMALGQVYEAVVPLKVTGAYENALNYYKEALKRNPNSPALYLTLARLELANDNTKNARTYISQALVQKPDYAEAIFLSAQIDVSAGNVDAAIASVKKVAEISPDDPNIFFQLGLLQYNKKSFTDAISSLERAVSLVKDYSNAKYFLGLSYYEVDRNEDAIRQFTEVLALNPGNRDVEIILDNLQAGKAPFANAKPPSTSKPPIPDKTTDTAPQI